MKKVICMIGLLALTSCGHMGHKCKDKQCDMHKKDAQCKECKCGKDCAKNNAQCPMDKMAPAQPVAPAAEVAAPALAPEAATPVAPAPAPAAKKSAKKAKK